MNVKQEIQNKEKSLTELMVKILKEPLSPLETSLALITNHLLDTQDKIAEINDGLMISNELAEESNKKLKQIHRKHSEDDIPASIERLNAFLAQQSINDRAFYSERIRSELGQYLDDGHARHLEQQALYNQLRVSVDVAFSDQQRLADQQQAELRSTVAIFTDEIKAGIKENTAANKLMLELLQQHHHVEAEESKCRHEELMMQLSLSQRRQKYLIAFGSLLAVTTIATVGIELWEKWHWVLNR